MKTKFCRKPHGKLNAIRNDARKGAVPPDSWEDLPIMRTNQVYQYCLRLFGMRKWRDKVTKRLPFNDFFGKVKSKFPTYKEYEIKDIYYCILQYSN